MNILVVDDSIVYRTAISQALSEVPGVDVLSSVSNGQVAVNYLQKNKNIDLITLDMEMPIMGGLETIKEIRKFNKNVIVIVFSSVTLQGAEKTIEALNAGANDFVTKIQGAGTIDDSLDKVRDVLLPKINVFKSRKYPLEEVHKKAVKDKTALRSRTLQSIVDNIIEIPKIIVLGSSTGGPEALTTIFKGLDKLKIPMLMAQHMPPLFTEKLAQMLDGKSDNRVVEAKGGEVIEAGCCYLAPGDYHMRLTKNLTIALDQNEKRHFVRPSVDNLFESVACNFKGRALSIILTGMGEDGAEGAVHLGRSHAYQFIQDEESSIVWGMPGAVQKAGVDHEVLSLNDFSTLLNLISKKVVG